MTDRDFASVAAAYRASIAGRILRRLGESSADAWRHSTAHARLQEMSALAAATDSAQRVAFGAMTVAVASAVHLGLRAVLPRYATSGLPWWWNVALVVLAVIVAVLAGPIAAAWPASLPARMWRRF